MRLTLRLTVVASAALLACLSDSSPAYAKTFSMSGEWYMNNGALIDVPVNGGPNLCAGGQLQTGCHDLFQPVNGGVPGSAIVSGTGAGPAAFVIPPHAFGQALGSQAAAVADVPTLIQLATSLVLDGPADLTQALAAAPAFGVGQDARFRKNAWSKDPGQTAGPTPRAAADFSWCPGVGGPSCLNGASATPASIEARVRYNAGPNQFGGTMAMMISGSGTTSTRITVLNLTTTSGAMSTLPILAQLASTYTGMNPRAVGAGYAYANTVMLPAAVLFQGYMTSTGMGNGLLTSTGPPATFGQGTPSAPAADTELNWGFPWTTGTVSIMNSDHAGTMGYTLTNSAMGSDNRTPAGAGTITLVAGGTTHRVGLAVGFETIDVLVLNFDPGEPTPTIGPPGLAVLIVTLALTTGYTVRRRFEQMN